MFASGIIAVGFVFAFGGQTDDEKISIVPECQEVEDIASVGPRPIEVDALPEAIARGGVCKMGELVVPIVARTK